MNQSFGGMGSSPTGTSSGRNATGLTGGDRIPKGYKKGQLSQFTPEQMQLFQQMFGQVSPDSYTSRLAGGDQSLFEEMEAPALQQFSGELGGLASRFSGLGGPGALSSRKSSGFQNTATSAASNFAQQLQGQRQGLQRQAIKDLMGMSSDLLGQRPYERFLTEKQEKQGLDWMGLAGAGLGATGGFFAGGPAGAVAGAGLGYNILGKGGKAPSSGDFMNFSNTFGGSSSGGGGNSFEGPMYGQNFVQF